MNVKLKIAAYVILIASAIWFLREFRLNYLQIGQTEAGAANNATTDLVETPSPKPSRTNRAVPRPAPGLATNQSTRNATGTNAGASTNAAEQTAAPEPPPATPPASNDAVDAAPPATGPAPAAASPPGKAVGDLLRLVGTLVVLGALIAYDLAQFFWVAGGRLFIHRPGEGTHDPEYELAEQAWVNGKPLDAIEMMREYLKKNPREQFVALRIAEIYEKDLRNFVAASMEYEEILKKKLPAERWGWAAIHLCNIYSRMGKQDKMKALLERIVRITRKTGAAKKARHNLGLPERAGGEGRSRRPAAGTGRSRMRAKRGYSIWMR